jgi:hypothetical protein
VLRAARAPAPPRLWLDRMNDTIQTYQLWAYLSDLAHLSRRCEL